MKVGPFGALDVIGLNTDYNITLTKAQVENDEELLKFAQLMKEEYIDKGHLGTSTSKGFYTYPNPSYRQENFLKAKGDQ